MGLQSELAAVPAVYSRAARQAHMVAGTDARVLSTARAAPADAEGIQAALTISAWVEGQRLVVLIT